MSRKDSAVFEMAFAGGGLDRAAFRRTDSEWLQAACDGAQVLALWQGKPLFCGDALAWLPWGHPALEGAAAPVFLGVEAGVTLLACDVSAWVPDADQAVVSGGFLDPTEQRHPALPPTHAFAELRGAMGRLSAREAELAATAKAVVGWHRSHRFCAACGAASAPAAGGWERLCPACGTKHFPRTDPVVIMIVTHGNRTLLGRSHGWPAGMYSCLAGFVEPGETIEAAVRREVAEEAGLEVGRVTYAASQPWPFPASLMIGCRAEAVSDTLTIDHAELEDARWVTREEMVGIMAGHNDGLRPARQGSIAHALLRAWVADLFD